MLEIIAEVGSVHDGSFGNALKLIELSKESGATAVKFQTHIAEFETTPYAPSPSYFSSEPRFNYFQRTSFDKDQWIKLKQHADKLGIGFISSPFSVEALDLLVSIGCRVIKIPSGEITNVELLQAIAKSGLKTICSSGMSSWQELDMAFSTLSSEKIDEIVMLQCSSRYPCPPEHVGLNILPAMISRYNCTVGLSDHTLSSAAAVSAIHYGATVIEKHITFSKKMFGSDAAHSLEPDEFKSFVALVNESFTILNSPVDKDDLSDYKEMKAVF